MDNVLSDLPMAASNLLRLRIKDGNIEVVIFNFEVVVFEVAVVAATTRV